MRAAFLAERWKWHQQRRGAIPREVLLLLVNRVVAKVGAEVLLVRRCVRLQLGHNSAAVPTDPGLVQISLQAHANTQEPPQSTPSSSPFRTLSVHVTPVSPKHVTLFPSGQ